MESIESFIEMCWESLGSILMLAIFFRSQHPMAFDSHEEKPDQNSSHNAAGGHKEQPRETSVTQRAASGREPKRKRSGSGICVCVCVCVCERERERERDGWIKTR